MSDPENLPTTGVVAGSAELAALREQNAANIRTIISWGYPQVSFGDLKLDTLLSVLFGDDTENRLQWELTWERAVAGVLDSSMADHQRAKLLAPGPVPVMNGNGSR